MEYFPYGETWLEKRRSSDPTAIEFKYTGKEQDKETGLYYYGARYYDARLSRWISVDPIIDDYLDGSYTNGVYNPRNLDFYQYSFNNPVVYGDPDGNHPAVAIGLLVFGYFVTEMIMPSKTTANDEFGVFNARLNDDGSIIWYGENANFLYDTEFCNNLKKSKIFGNASLYSGGVYTNIGYYYNHKVSVFSNKVKELKKTHLLNQERNLKLAIAKINQNYQRYKQRKIAQGFAGLSARQLRNRRGKIADAIKNNSTKIRKYDKWARYADTLKMNRKFFNTANGLFLDMFASGVGTYFRLEETKRVSEAYKNLKKIHGK